ncbi:trehalose-phosphatase [Billgrantia diversa]|uniref:trehalose-phosphatase n=1 Tax=Halomonas sp. MCCC 1A13316 TaxID=2733487 RepID=UPI0018A4BF21|nr:trehalose-phosphatase [Halomonas sp. MCCC 1A13316]QOR38032.1 trehalose-phosphatase [Halomonas sp. MCCC 1A13316]
MKQLHSKPNLTLTCYRAGVFDLDGVVTDSARLHCLAWQRLFDAYRAERVEQDRVSFAAFDPNEDYRRYIDGKPRYEGVRSFLESRMIHLPFGTPQDSADRETVCGLGNRKQRFFEQLLASQGVEVFASSIAFIESIRAAGLKTAVVSSSKNARVVLTGVGAHHLFDAVVDGIDSERLGLNGKPHPDIFSHAASLLAIPPERAFAVEDALSGVEAASRAGFGLVVGVDRAGQREDLLAHGADIVIDDLIELLPSEAAQGAPLPDALAGFDGIAERLGHRLPAIFLDYDGTLTPIVARPELAILDEAMRLILKRLGQRCSVAIVSGRDRANVAELVGIGSLVYAGSHGFDITGPGGLHMQYERAAEFLPHLATAETQLQQRLAGIRGVLVERKRFAIAIHYRLVAESDVDRVLTTVESVAEGLPQLRRTGGKKVFELRPRLPWDKGKAVFWLLEALDLSQADVMPIYLGDDETDEDAFAAMREIGGLGLFVGDASQVTAASHRLSDTVCVGRFLERLADMLETHS